MASPLFRQLAKVYADKEIQYPHLKAITLAQWMLESGRGTSALAVEHYNFGGLKWRPEMVGFATKVRYNAHDGVDDYCKFASLEAFITGYWRFLDRAPYTGWEEHTETEAEFIGFIGPRYTPSPGYAERVLALLNEATTLLSEVTAEDDTEVVVTPTGDPGATLRGTIIIDPGHGGAQTVGSSSPNNAVSFSGIKEKTMTLELGLLVREALQDLATANNYGLNVLMTRTTDVNVGIADRARKVREKDADLFLSIHFNGSTNTAARRTETFIRAVSNGNVNYDDDKRLAERVQKKVFETIKSFAPQARNGGVKDDTQTQHGRLGVLNDSSLGTTSTTNKCRACLVEVEFITNEQVDNLLNNNANALQVRKAIARAIAEALVDDLRMHA